MRKKIVAGNWKMNNDFREGTELVNEIIDHVDAIKEFNNQNMVEIVISPPFVHLNECAKLTEKMNNVFIAAQNCHSETSGAYTGEVSAKMLASIGTKYVIIGHSERRNYFNESHEFLAEKVNSVLSNNLFPIFCCGESLSQRESGEYFSVIKQQLDDSLFHLDEEGFGSVIIAYEPVWAIGTGITATAEQAQEIHEFIRNVIAEKYSKDIAESTTILYGGSCKSSNAKELFSNNDVDGGLIGGASLKSTEFVNIIKHIL